MKCCLARDRPPGRLLPNFALGSSPDCRRRAACLMSGLTGTRRRWLGAEADRPRQIRYVRYLLRQCRWGACIQHAWVRLRSLARPPRTVLLAIRGLAVPRFRAARCAMANDEDEPEAPSRPRLRRLEMRRGCPWKTQPAPSEESRRCQLGH